MDLRRRFGGHIRLLRKTRGLTQEELSARSDLSVDTLRRVERAVLSPTLETIARLAAGLELSLVTLFQGMEESKVSWAAEVADLLARRTDAQSRRGLAILRFLFALDDEEQGSP